MTEAATDPADIDAEIASYGRSFGCSVCSWIESRDPDEQAVWDRNLAKPLREAGHKAILTAMQRRGFENSVKTIESHRSAGHRRG